MAAIEPGKIRNVAVVGHRGTGKTSLVEALLFQTDEINRLGTVEAGTTVSDWDEDEQKRRDVDLAHAHAHGLAGAEDQPRSTCPGDPSFQGEARCALRVVEGALVVVNAVMGLEVGTARVKHLADDYGLARVALRQHARPRARRLLPRRWRRSRSSSPRAASPCTSRSAPSTSSRASSTCSTCAPTSNPNGGKEGEPMPIPDDMAGDRAGVPREAARRGRRRPTRR